MPLGVGAAAVEAPGVLGDAAADEVRFGWRRAGAQRDVRFTLGEIKPAIGRDQLQQDPRMRLAKRMQRRHQHLTGKKLISGDAHRTGQAALQGGRLAGERISRDLDRAGGLDELFPMSVSA